jgi:ATP-dependent helicase HrpA
LSSPELADLQLALPPELPITDRAQDIAKAIAENPVVIIAGETGSGKTTQLPKICLQLGRGSAGLIGHTQPRRLAARTVAGRIAQELGQQIGEVVGYQVRFTDHSSAATRVKLMTDGILLAEIQRDRLLKKYDTIIIDEAHERSLNIDFLLGYLKQLLPRRPDLKLIITSATIDVESFSRHFGDAPVIEVSGRTWPVEIKYFEAEAEDGDLAARITQALQRILLRQFGEPADVLVFLSGEGEIREVAKQLRHLALEQVEVLPLYARLPQKEQNRVFRQRRGSGVRVILATNVAETSLTVPGIRYVIDPGYARVSRYSFRSKLQRLPIEAISQASASQRAGRCGRTADGVCLRLYSEEDFAGRPEFTEPEIQRTNLAAVILQMLRLGLGDVEQFPFINPPDPRLVRDGYMLLQELRAVDTQGVLTALGSRMAGFPTDPRFSRMLLAAQDLGCLREILVICSALSVQDPRERPADRQQAADEKHRRFNHEKSDFMAFLQLWDYYEQQRQELSQNRLRKLCQKDFLAYMRMREWRDVHYQLTVACRQGKLLQNRETPGYEAIHRALMSGLLGNLAQWHEGHEYRGSRNRSLQIFPGSSQFRKKPKWLLAAEVVETSKVYARVVASIDPSWALDINPDLLKHHYYEPHWQARSGRVMALQRISLYGLVLVDKQRVHYGPINACEAREILIRAALVEGRTRRPPAFLRHNQALVTELQELESRFRRRDIVVDDQALYNFYDERLPDNITTLGRLAGWLKKDRKADQLLRLGREQLMLRAVDEDLGEQFPDALRWQDLELPLSYHFEPGDPADGVSLTLPLGLLNRAPRYLGDWLVAGLLREKCIALVKALPKGIRKQLVPVPDMVDRALAELQAQDRPLIVALGERLAEVAGVKIAIGDWREQDLDDYYRLNYRIVNEKGELLGQGRDLSRLVERYRDDTRASLSADHADSPAREGLTRWDFDEVPLSWRSSQAGVEIESWPALVDCGDSVAIELLDYHSQARIAHRGGVLRLLQLQCAQPQRQLRKQLLRGNEFSLLLAGAGLDREALLQELLTAVFSQAMLEPLQGDLPRTKLAFEACLSRGKGQLVSVGNEVEAIMSAALAGLSRLRQQLAGLPAQGLELLRQDLSQQIQGLWGEGCVSNTPCTWLRHYPRYMQACTTRLERFSGQRGKDDKNREQLTALQQPLLDYLERHPQGLLLNPHVEQYRWMLEELRVSLFAQSLGTALPVSAKRLQECWQKVAEFDISNPP